MNILVVLIPVTVLLGLVGLAAFVWTLRSDQYDDPEGAAARILSTRYDDDPAGGDAGEEVGKNAGENSRDRDEAERS